MNSVAAVLLVASLVFIDAARAYPAPAIFTGVGKQSGGIIGYPTLITTIDGPTSGAGFGSGSVTAGGDFTIPKSAFSRATPGYTFSLAPLYYRYVRIAQRNEVGMFNAGYLPAGVPVVGGATNAIQPAVTNTPRTGFVRVTPGPVGFGGRMPMNFTKVYRYDIHTSLAVLKVTAMEDNSFGGATLGSFAPGGLSGAPTCCRVYPSGSPSAALTIAVGSSRGPWVTGMAFAAAPQGNVVTTTSHTGVDARAPVFDTGAISLVTPRLQYHYRGDGAGTLQDLLSSRAIIHSIEINFAPEPGLTAYLASGLMGLVGLTRRRQLGRIRLRK